MRDLGQIALQKIPDPIANVARDVREVVATDKEFVLFFVASRRIRRQYPQRLCAGDLVGPGRHCRPRVADSLWCMVDPQIGISGWPELTADIDTSYEAAVDQGRFAKVVLAEFIRAPPWLEMVGPGPPRTAAESHPGKSPCKMAANKLVEKTEPVFNLGVVEIALFEASRTRTSVA